jgi:hypothetical protein
VSKAQASLFWNPDSDRFLLYPASAKLGICPCENIFICGKRFGEALKMFLFAENASGRL